MYIEGYYSKSQLFKICKKFFQNKSNYKNRVVPMRLITNNDNSNFILLVNIHNQKNKTPITDIRSRIFFYID